MTNILVAWAAQAALAGGAFAHAGPALGFARINGAQHSPKVHKPSRNRGTGQGVHNARLREEALARANYAFYSGIPSARSYPLRSQA